MSKVIKFTDKGFSYIDVSLKDCLSWGGMGICNSCGKVSNSLKLVFILGDTYCDNCFNDWISNCSLSQEELEEDLHYQYLHHLKYYRFYISKIKKED